MTPDEIAAVATDGELRDWQWLQQRAADLDQQRAGITYRLNVLRQRFAQRRLASARGRPFRSTRPRAIVAAREPQR